MRAPYRELREPWLLPAASLLFVLSACQRSHVDSVTSGSATAATAPAASTGAAAQGPSTPGSAAASPTKPRGNDGPRIALLVGINDYLYKDDIPDLHGTGNDVEAMQDVLVRRFGFAARDILVLRDRAATKASVIASFRRHLIEPAAADTVAVFFYSGHGSQMVDPTGEKPDGLDETLVMQDSGRSAGRENRDLVDKEINGLLSELGRKTSHVTVILDSCHSGTATRAAGIPKMAKPDLRPPKPQPRSPGPAAAPVVYGPSGWRPQDAPYVLVAASRSDEYSYEQVVDGKPMGALTWFLTRALWKAQTEETYRDLMDRISIDVNAVLPAQHPQIEGLDRDAVVFGTRMNEPEPYVEVRAKQGQLELHAGAVQGITEGSLFAVYPAAAKKFQEMRPIATVETLAVGATTAQVRLTSGGPSIPDAARAVETQHRFNKTALRLAYLGLDRSPALQSVKAALDRYPHIQMSTSSTDYDALLRQAADGSMVLEKGTPEPVGQPVAQGPQATDRVTEKVLALAKWFSVRAIENERGFAGDAPWDVSVSTKPADGHVAAGDTVSVVLANRSNVRLYLSLLNLSFDGSVSQVYPPPGAAEFIEPSSSWEKPLVACLPQGRKEAIRDVLKVFLTTEPTDLSFLEQQRVRAVGAPSILPTGRSPLEGVLMTNALGMSPRGLSRPLPPSGWATKQASVLVDYAPSAKPCTSD
jgi:hypothetical protein